MTASSPDSWVFFFSHLRSLEGRQGHAVFVKADGISFSLRVFL